MYHKMNIQSLCAGMYVVDTGVSWLRHPYLYCTEGEVTQQELDEIHRQEFTEAYIDLTRCRPGTLPPELEALTPSVTAEEEKPEHFLPPPPKVTIEEELPRARKVFNASLTMAKNMMDGVRKGQVGLSSAEPIVDGILESLDRNANALFSLGKLRQKDDYTYTHSVNVSVMATIFARGIGISRSALHAIGMGGLLHDIGKSLIPMNILNAPHRLNDREMQVMKRHPALGHEFLTKNQVAVPAEALHVVLEHHEQYCGGGYPNALAGDVISVPGRIAAIVDVFDALSSKRVYKEPMPFSKALSILYSMRDKEFFPGMVERFIRILGVYPLGSAVELDNGCRAVVCEANMTAPMRPKVILVRDKIGKDMHKIPCDLAASGAPGIAKAISPQKLGADPADVLGITV